MTNFSSDLEKIIPELRAFARSLCGDPSFADDIVQEACLRAWDKQSQFNPERGTFKIWMFRIVRNEFYRVKRRSWRAVHTESETFETILRTDCHSQSKAELAELVDHIFDLSDDQRDAFILIVAAGFTYDEAGEICGCSAGTIKSRVSRARQAIIAADAHGPLKVTAEKRQISTSGADPLSRIHMHLSILTPNSIAA